MIERAVDVYVANSDIPGLARLAVFALILYLAYMLSTRSYMVIMAKTTNQILLTIRQQLYEHIQTLSFHFFDSRPDRKDSGARRRGCQFLKGSLLRQCDKAASGLSDGDRRSCHHAC